MCNFNPLVTVLREFFPRMTSDQSRFFYYFDTYGKKKNNLNLKQKQNYLLKITKITNEFYKSGELVAFFNLRNRKSLKIRHTVKKVIYTRGRHSGHTARSPVFGLRALGSGWMSTGHPSSGSKSAG